MRVTELKTEMDRQFGAVNQHFRAIDERFSAIDERFNTIDERVSAIDRRFADVDRRFTELERRIADEGARTRRHFDVVADQLRSDTALLAETVAAIHRDQVAGRSEQGTLLSALSDHELRLRALERHAGH